MGDRRQGLRGEGGRSRKSIYGVKEVLLQDRRCLRSGRAEVVRGSSEEEGEGRESLVLG